MVEQQLDPRRQQVAGGVAAGVDEQEEEPLQLAVGEALAVDLGLDEPGGDVVAGFGALAGRGLAAAYDSISSVAAPRCSGVATASSVVCISSVSS